MTNSKAYVSAFKGIGSIIVRHVFLLVNAIIFAVVILLYVFDDKEASLFLGIVILFNILLGIIQDTRALIALESLQLLTALHVLRIASDGSVTSVLAEQITKGDRVRLKLGDQVPCDGVLESVNGLEVSEALRTGESDSFPKVAGETVSAGDIVSAGRGVLVVQTNFRDSRMAQMTKEAKKYAAKPSPIQLALTRVITYSGYVLLIILCFVVARGLIVHESPVNIVMNVGALASIIVPQGLVVITSLLFAFGAASYSREHVLFQEINATEKLGRIKNLCMDKTGTLTENFLDVEAMHVHPNVSKEMAGALALAYIRGSGDSSQTVAAIQKYLGNEEEQSEIVGTLPFSSWRQYGAISMRGTRGEEMVLSGSPDIFLPYIKDTEDKKWVEQLIADNAHQGKRMLAVVRARSSGELSQALTETDLSPACVFVFQSGLRDGIRDAIAFFQERGVHVRIISGDNPETVKAVAAAAGVRNADTVITGTEMSKWTPEEFDAKVHACTIFARIVPEQKVQIIESLKKNGFTAMVGDGANDALAIKKADLGIAMFDGAPATRRLAGVILMNNSFSALPGGVRLADNFISVLEVFAGIFINQSVLGAFCFVIVSAFGYPFPLTPLNITLINYFTVGAPGMLLGYWAIQPRAATHAVDPRLFLSKVMPFVVYSAALEAIAVALIFALSPLYLKTASSNTLVALAFIVSGFTFFVFASGFYRGGTTKKEQQHIFLLSIGELVLLGAILQIPLLVRFFNITTPYPSMQALGVTLLALFALYVCQFALTKFFSKKVELPAVSIIASSLEVR